MNRGSLDSTIAEVSFGVALIIGLYFVPSLQGSAVLLAFSALAMTLSGGIKLPLNSSVSSTLERHGYIVHANGQATKNPVE